METNRSVMGQFLSSVLGDTTLRDIMHVKLDGKGKELVQIPLLLADDIFKPVINELMKSVQEAWDWEYEHPVLCKLCRTRRTAKTLDGLSDYTDHEWDCPTRHGPTTNAS